MNKVELSAIERKILNCIQEDIPLVSSPFKILSKRIGIEEKQLLKRIKRLRSKGIIRKFSAGLNHKKLGFKSSLIAIRTPLKKLNSVTKKIVAYPEVTHCFLRKAEFNLWVVFVYKNLSLKNFLHSLTKEVGEENILNFPTRRKFKLETSCRV